MKHAPIPTRQVPPKRTSNERYADALAEIRREAQARYVRTYGHASALYSEKGPFK